MHSIKSFIERRLKLKVNDAKSGCASVEERQFLGYQLLNSGSLVVSNQSIKRLKDKVRRLTRRNRGASFENVVVELNQSLRGWINYFRLTDRKSELAKLDSWIRRKLRCYRIKQRGHGGPLARFLLSLGAPRHMVRKVSSSGKGWWCLSCTPAVCCAMSNKWFVMQGLVSLKEQSALLNF
ncbi:Retron-type reverse transcriptase (plasmid) [Piscirickettsia salmonis]|nr:group II intron maturase-specific domain-containing protein [Piscirickettsia salmonis]QGP52561.1 Retron-type reverse transcriptase [Piscirickettsia salmonis]